MTSTLVGHEKTPHQYGARKFLFGIFVGVFVGCFFANHSLTCCPSQWLRLVLNETGGDSHGEGTYHSHGEGIGTEGGAVGEVAKPDTRNVEQTVSIGGFLPKWAQKKKNQKVSIGQSAMSTTKSCEGHFESRPGTEFDLQSGPQIRFVMLAMARSGSHFLSSLLGQHPAIVMNYEAFSPVGVWAEGWNHTRKSKRDNDRNKFVNLLFDPTNTRYKKRKGSAKAFGFKIAPTHLSVEEFGSLVEAGNVKKIVLRRRQTLRQFVSNLKAMRTQTWAHSNTTGLKVHVDVDKYKHFASWQRGFYDTCIDHHFGQRSLAEKAQWFFVDYEALVKDTVRTVNNVCSFLGVERIGQKLNASTTQQDASPVSESILNFDELRLAFANNTLDLNQ